MPQDYEYRAATIGKDGTVASTSATTTNPKEAGDLYRRWRNVVSTADADTVLQRRPVAPWETVESTKV